MTNPLESYSYDGLIAGDFPITTDRATLLSGQVLTRGALLGKISASGANQGKLTQCDSGASDGSEEPFAILVNDADATGGDVVTDIYLTGCFNGAKVGTVTGDDIGSFKDQLRRHMIFIVTTQGA